MKIIDRMNIHTTPAIIGTEVRLIISSGSIFKVPAIINTTGATGETALNKFPANPIGTEIAIGLIPAASAKGTINGTIAKNKAMPLPLNNTMSAVNRTRINGRIKLRPCPWKFCIVDCSASIKPIDFNPVTKTEAATINATIGMALPIPSKNFSVLANTALSPLCLINSQMMLIITEATTAISTLMENVIPAARSKIYEIRSNIIGNIGKIA
jgi:hypothetical protein